MACRGRALWLVVVVISIVLLSAPAASHAGVALTEERVLRSPHGAPFPVRLLFYRADPGEANRLAVRFREGFVHISDSAGVEPGEGCSAVSTDGVEVRCALDDLSFLEYLLDRRPVLHVRLGDEDDRARVTEDRPDLGRLGTALDGGAGNDLLRGGLGSSRFHGGEGDDVIVASGGEDFVDEDRASNGSDTILLRAGHATISYRKRVRPVRIDLTGDRDDGEAGERDRVAGASATVFAGHGADTLVGGGGPDEFVGGAGRDRLLGGAGDDTLFVDQADYVALTPEGRFATADGADGGPGKDRLIGNRGPNRLAGGAGRDHVSGGGGRDRMEARDGSRDDVGCGTGLDRAVLDRYDFITTVGSQACEQPRRSVPATAAFFGADSELDTGNIGTQRAASFHVACPGDAAPRCVGVVRLLHRGIALASAPLNIRRNRIALVDVTINPYGRRLVLRRDRLPVVVAVSTFDRHGVIRTNRARYTSLLSSKPAVLAGACGDLAVHRCDAACRAGPGADVPAERSSARCPSSQRA
jgi:hypothetical protein